MSASARAALDRWKKKMIEELGEDGFNVYSQGNNVSPIFENNKDNKSPLVVEM
jgi:hypothetical protein